MVKISYLVLCDFNPFVHDVPRYRLVTRGRGQASGIMVVFGGVIWKHINWSYSRNNGSLI